MLGASGPSTVRDLLEMSFVHRECTRFRGRSSELLDCAFNYDHPTAIDLDRIPELQTVERTASGVRIGAFARLDRLSAVVPELFSIGMPPEAARLCLSLLGAEVRVAASGTLRTVRIDAWTRQAHECPVSLQLSNIADGTGFGSRRLATNDGASSFMVETGVLVRVGVRGNMDVVRIAIAFDGSSVRARLAEARLEGKRIDPGTFPDAARAAAYVIMPVDARTSAASRAVPPLIVRSLRDALANARGHVA